MKGKGLLLAVVSTALAAPSAFGLVFSGSLRLSTQAEVDAAAVYTEISGSLTISGADINDLTPLAGITSIGSTLSLSDNPGLTVVTDAFPALTTIGGGIYAYRNVNMTSFNGFNALVETGDNIDFWFNDSVVTISGFSALQTAGWSLEFGGNPLLEQLPKFESLTTISSSLFILDNVSLERITGFQALEHVDWSFQINGNTSLNDLCGFHNYFSAHNPYSGDGAFDIKDNGPGLPDPAVIQDVLDAGPCPAPSPVSASTSGGQITLQWDPVPGWNYYVSWSTDMLHWTSVAVGASGSWTDTTPSAGGRYYRISH